MLIFASDLLRNNLEIKRLFQRHLVRKTAITLGYTGIMAMFL